MPHQIFHLLEVFGDLCLLEIIHLVHHTDGGVDEGIGAEGTCPLA